MLTIHHLGISQSERIIWLCEELALPYELKRYDRDPATRGAPQDYRALHPLGAAPVITDGDITLAESGAIVDYITGKYGHSGLVVGVDEPNFADYLYWFHFVNGTLQAMFGRNLILNYALPADSPLMLAMVERLDRAVALVDERLRHVPYLAGEALTAADIMMVFTLTTMRHFTAYDLSAYPGILAYLQRIGERPAYQAAMKKGDPGMALLLT